MVADTAAESEPQPEPVPALDTGTNPAPDPASGSPDAGADPGSGSGGRGTKRTRPTRAQTRARVLDAAARVFADRGIAATSLNEVAAAAGLTKGAVYSSFSGKDDLVLAILEEHLIERMHRATEVYHQMTDLGDATIEAGARLLEGVQSDSTWHRLYLEYWGLAMREPGVHAGLAERRTKLRDAIAGAIRAAARRHEVRLPLAPEALAITLLALSNGLAVERGIDAASVPENLFIDVLWLLVGVDSTRVANPGR